MNEERFELALDGESVGYATSIDCGHEIWIAELWVDPRHRQRGFASVLLDAVLSRYGNQVLALSAEPFEWTDRAPVPEAARVPAAVLAAWYERRGFRPDGLHRMVRPPGPSVPAADRPADPGGANRPAESGPAGQAMTFRRSSPEAEMEM